VRNKIPFKTIDAMDGLERLRGLVLKKQTGACTGCLLYNCKVESTPKGKVRRPEAAGSWDRMDIDLSGQQKFKFAGHDFNYFIVGVSSQKLRIVTGVTASSICIEAAFYGSKRSTERNQGGFCYCADGSHSQAVLNESRTKDRNRRAIRALRILKSLKEHRCANAGKDHTERFKSAHFILVLCHSTCFHTCKHNFPREVAEGPRAKDVGMGSTVSREVTCKSYSWPFRMPRASCALAGAEHIELPARLLDYFLRSNKSNINQS